MKSIMRIAMGVAVGLLSLSGSVSAQDSSSSTGGVASSSGAASSGAASSSSGAAAAAASSSTGAKAPLASNSICDRYAFDLDLNSAEGELTLMNMLVVRAILGNVTEKGVTVEGLANNALTKPFFNGAHADWRSPAQNGVYGTGMVLPNFLAPAGSVQQVGLITSLNKFFGSALECTAGGFKTMYPYTGNNNMTAVHSAMPITGEVFNAFNGQIANSALSYGISEADVNSVGTFLASFQRGAAATDKSICNDVATCDCAGNFNGAAGQTCTPKMSAASSLGASVISVIMAAAATMFAMRQ